MRALFLSLVSVVAFATPVHAECAWISWQSLGGRGASSGFNIPLDRLAAYKTQAACLTEVRARARWIPMAKEKGATVADHPSGALVEGSTGIVNFSAGPTP